ncbi:MAG: radical SAM protein, partial [Clostridiales bacterium]|nr:radical SAM protein [Clostridiales bacterium]
IRLGSIEPTIITSDFINVVRELPRLCPHYHISLQSGSDTVLKRMNRKYSTAEYYSAITSLKAVIPDVAITTDIMVGFPGETQEEFIQSCEFVKKVAFSRIHVFRYSPRKGTLAATFTCQISKAIKDERAEQMITLGKELSLQFHSGYIGRVMDVLIEDENESTDGRIPERVKNQMNEASENYTDEAFKDHKDGGMPEGAKVKDHINKASGDNMDQAINDHVNEILDEGMNGYTHNYIRVQVREKRGNGNEKKGNMNSFAESKYKGMILPVKILNAKADHIEGLLEVVVYFN